MILADYDHYPPLTNTSTSRKRHRRHPRKDDDSDSESSETRCLRKRRKIFYNCIASSEHGASAVGAGTGPGLWTWPPSSNVGPQRSLESRRKHAVSIPVVWRLQRAENRRDRWRRTMLADEEWVSATAAAAAAAVALVRHLGGKRTEPIWSTEQAERAARLSPRKAQEVPESENCCVVCRHNESRVACLPCGHLCMCGECARLYVPPDTPPGPEDDPAAPSSCPVCRQRLGKLCVVYRPGVL